MGMGQEADIGQGIRKSGIREGKVPMEKGRPRGEGECQRKWKHAERKPQGRKGMLIMMTEEERWKRRSNNSKKCVPF
jgi:hypothetical protein